jgi:serine acetyltransferase
VTIGEGASIGALCAVSKSVEPGEIIVSIQTMKVGTRDVQSLRKMMAAVEKQDEQSVDVALKERRPV